MSHKKNQKEMKSSHGIHRSFKYKVIMFSIYLLVFLAIFTWLDYYAYEFYNPLPFIILSLLLAIVATYLHIKRGKRSEVDELADKL